jgi:hypothetical protein
LLDALKGGFPPPEFRSKPRPQPRNRHGPAVDVDSKPLIRFGRFLSCTFCFPCISTRRLERDKTKPEIALEQIRWACETDLPGDLVVIDAGYGNASQLRAGITELGKHSISDLGFEAKPTARPGSQERAPRCGGIARTILRTLTMPRRASTRSSRLGRAGAIKERCAGSREEDNRPMGCERLPWNILQYCSSTGKPVAKPDAAGPWWVPLLEVQYRRRRTPILPDAGPVRRVVRNCRSGGGPELLIVGEELRSEPASH